MHIYDKQCEKKDYIDSYTSTPFYTSLTMEFTSLSPICQLVRVRGEGDVMMATAGQCFSVMNISQSRGPITQICSNEPN